jgi:O-antigen/teichoic acid export membrane protein
VIINTYVSLIFNAMATDYYPRLAAVSNDNKLCKHTINQQAEIALLILAPILIVFLIFINWIIILLYSNRFVEVNEMIQWAALGMFFKTIGWSLGFVFLAKGTTKLFFWNELFATGYILGFNLAGYYYWGLTGLGLSFVAAYLIYTIQVFVVSNAKFEFNFDKNIITIFTIQFSLALAAFLVVKFLDQNLAYFVGMILILISGWFSLSQLNKRLGLIGMLNNYKKRTKIN